MAELLADVSTLLTIIILVINDNYKIFYKMCHTPIHAEMAGKTNAWGKIKYPELIKNKRLKDLRRYYTQ